MIIVEIESSFHHLRVLIPAASLGDRYVTSRDVVTRAHM